MAGRIKELLNNVALFTIANLSSKVIVFLMVPFYTTVMSTAAFGDANIIQSTSTFLYPIFTCLISDAVLRFCYLKEMNIKAVFSEGFRFTMASGLGTILFVGFAQFFIPDKYWTANIWFIPLLVLSSSFSRLMHCFCRGIDRVKISAIAGVIQTIIVVSFNLIFLGIFKFGVWAYLLAFLLGDVVGILYMIFKVKIGKYIEYKRNNALMHSMLRFSLPLVPNNISWWAINNLNQYIVLAFLGLSAVGIYTATLRIPSTLTVLSEIFTQAWLLSALKDYEKEESKQFIRKMSGLFLSLIAMFTAIIIILSYPLSLLLLKGEFSNYWYISPFMFVSVFLGVITGFLGSIFSAERKNKIQATSTMIGACISIIGSLIFTKYIGIIVVAISTTIGYFIITSLRLWGALKYIKLDLNFRKLIIQTTILVVEAILVMNKLYYLASIVILCLIIINMKSLKLMIIYSYSIIHLKK